MFGILVVVDFAIDGGRGQGLRNKIMIFYLRALEHVQVCSQVVNLLCRLAGGIYSDYYYAVYQVVQLANSSSFRFMVSFLSLIPQRTIITAPILVSYTSSTPLY